ncbi:sugar ABC transporter substrate-binding protein [Cellulomonas sp. 73-92]|uniref:ABC transporter substrate-binding protein n=1 Tax=Cellulomonas sp. 73-92 TaxID=1895740 RepID=UPI0025C67D63|nr:sugar ABC transporter substrate-binding protein [Cellulomonas sp. 73-92]
MEITVKSAKRTSRRAAVIAVVAVLGAVTACSSSGGAGPTGGTSSGASNGPVTLEFWSFYTGSEADYVNKWVNDYNAAHKDVQIHHKVVSQTDYTTTLIPTALANGTAPDILYVEPATFTKYADAGALADLTPYYTDDLKKDILPAVLKSVTYNDKLLALPIELETLGLFYDKTALAAEGVTPPKTWDEMKADAKKLTNDKRFGVALPVEDTGYTLFNFWPYLWMAGGDIKKGSDGKYSIDTPQMAQALDFYGSFFQAGSSPKSLQIGPWDVGNVATGVAAMQESGSYAIKATETDYKAASIGVVPLPSPDGGKGITVAGGQKLAVNAASKHIKEAADFIFSGFGSTDLSVASGWVTQAKFAYPARQSVIDANKDIFNQGLRADFTNFYDTARPEPSYPAAVTQALQTALQDVMFGGSTGADAAKKAQATANAG